MSGPAYILGSGIVTCLGSGREATLAALAANRCGLSALEVFRPLQEEVLPVGQVAVPAGAADLPRTHRLALEAAAQAMAAAPGPPDAVIVGTTTGGMLESETLLRQGETDCHSYRFHGLTTVAELLGRRFGCCGPVLTVSTACSSGTVAIALAMKMLRQGLAGRILAGGVDSLCRLTYFGFHSLQLVDRHRCRPLDRDRQGMNVAEGAAMLLLAAEPEQDDAPAILGAALSCDAHHPAAPHPEGRGALAAMRAALADAALAPEEIGYINLHGTGTRENDLAEARAVRRLFSRLPPLSSIKGATGHGLAAAGAVEAVVAALAVEENLLPANTGLAEPDPALALQPLRRPERRPVERVLSNSFGFGGNNGSLVIGRAGRVGAVSGNRPWPLPWLSIHGWSCLSGAGMQAQCLDRLLRGERVAGQCSASRFADRLDPRLIRRLKRLPVMALALALAMHEDSALETAFSSVFLGTGWGALSETHDFLERLAETAERFPSPTDFVGSVHNGPAGQVAIMLGARGANITFSGGDGSFEQALLGASLWLGDEERGCVMAVDEAHGVLSSLFDPSVAASAGLADGGGGFVLGRQPGQGRARVRLLFHGRADDGLLPAGLVRSCGGPEVLGRTCGLILAGLPLACREQAEKQLHALLRSGGLRVPVVRYRELTGEFASASALAAVLAARLVHDGEVPAGLCSPGCSLSGRRVLVLGLGMTVTAMEFAAP